MEQQENEVKGPLGLTLVAACLILLGVCAVIGAGAPFASTVAPLARIAAGGMGAFTIATGIVLLRRRRYALKWYFTWAISCMVLGAAREYVGEGEPLVVVSAFFVLVGGIWTAVGLYLRRLLRQTS